VPVFVITGSEDASRASEETPASRRHPFEKSLGRAGGGPPAYLLFLQGATHSSYQGKSKASRLLGEKIDDASLQAVGDITASGTLLFLDAHLRGDAAALEILGQPSDQDQGSLFDALSPGVAEFRVK
jgi:hypothetical protein